MRRGLLTFAVVLALAAPAADAQTLSATRQSYLQVAADGGNRARALWYDARKGWWRQRLGSRIPASLWNSYPLFESFNAIALADPSPAARQDAAAFGLGAERYLNRALDPIAGYGPYPGERSPRNHAWFDDNGWWGIAFVDAYRATGVARFLGDARRAFDFIAVDGWDGARGGIWWSTYRSHKTGESLAASTLLATLLYEQTQDPYYLAEALKFIRWGDSDFAHSQGLYDRRDDDRRPLAYIQGPMLLAQASLCRDLGDRALCDRAEQIATRSVTRFARLDMGPQYDAVFLRCLLGLYELDGNARWYRFVAAAAARALGAARDGGGTFSLTWSGRPAGGAGVLPHMLMTHAATVSVFAWLAATPDTQSATPAAPPG